MSYKKQEDIANTYDIQPGDNLLSEIVLNRSPKQLMENADLANLAIENISAKAGIAYQTGKIATQPNYDSEYYLYRGVPIKRSIELLDKVIFNVYQLIESQNFSSLNYKITAGETFTIDAGNYAGGARYSDITESFYGTLVCAYQPQRATLDVFTRTSYTYGDDWTNATNPTNNVLPFVTVCPTGTSILMGVLRQYANPRVDIYQSNDEGASWNLMNTSWTAPNADCRLRMVQGYSSKFFMFNASNANCYTLYSADGINWTQQSAVVGDYCSGFHRITDQVVMVYSTGGALFWNQSDDDGATWGVARNIGVVGVGDIDVIVLPNGFWLIIYEDINNPGAINYILSRNNGISWSAPSVLVSSNAYRPSLCQTSNGDVLSTYHRNVSGNLRIYGTFLKLESS